MILLGLPGPKVKISHFTLKVIDVLEKTQYDTFISINYLRLLLIKLS